MLFLMTLIQMPDAAALDIEAMIDAHAGAVKRCAYLCLRDERLSEDICQEVFLRLWQRPPRAEDERGMRAWLMRVTINACRDCLRTPWMKRVRGASDDELNSRPAGTPPPEGEALTRERDEALYKAVMDLPIKYREPIILHYYFDYTQRETARIMSISDNALRARLMRARDKLRAALGEEVEL